MKYPANKWFNIEKCPACSCSELISNGLLVGNTYFFGDEKIAFPPEGISIAECQNCGLYFKSTLPTPYFLAEIITRQAGKVWNENYDFIDEKKLIKKFIYKNNFDLLDIGPSNGALLKAFSDSTGRRSGLDIIQHPGLEKQLNGEFIHGLLDEEILNWSEKPYDVITLYDVFEHFYNPKLAFINLKNLLKTNGIFVLETGNVESYYPKKMGLNQWWYANLFEHHIFWQAKSIEYYANKYGFKILYMKNIRHKSWRYRSIIFKINKILQFSFWFVLPNLYSKFIKKFNKNGTAPWTPLTKDHLVVVMQKI